MALIYRIRLQGPRSSDVHHGELRINGVVDGTPIDEVMQVDKDAQTIEPLRGDRDQNFIWRFQWADGSGNLSDLIEAQGILRDTFNPLAPTALGIETIGEE